MDVKNRRDYVAFMQDALDQLREDPFYNAFQNCLGRGKNSLTIYKKQNTKQLDRTWIDVVEDTIINLDNIVRNPRKYIAREEEIVPIELSRNITTESVKHLAQHTNMIAEIDEHDNITPNKILNIHKEESFDIYENRFAYTTLLKTKEFVDKRAKLIEDSSGENNIINVNLESMFKYGDKALDFSIKLKSKSSSLDNSDENEKLNEDIQRVKKIQTIINTFCASKFAQEMSHFALVRPPITRTNVILKNPDFKKVLALWQFINTYEKLGFEIHSTETLEDISKDSYDNLADNIFINYLFYYNMILLNTPQEKVVRKSKYSPKFVRKFLENAVNSGDLEDVELQNVVRMASPKKEEMSAKQEKSILNAIDFALYQDELFLTAKQRAKEEAEKERFEKLEKARIEREKKKQIEEARRERIKQREQTKKEKEKERERLAREAEAIRLHEIAKRKKVEELRIKLFRKALKIDTLVELAQRKARILAKDPNRKIEKDTDIDKLDPKVRAKLLEVVKKALDIRVDEKLKAQTTPPPVVDTPMTDKEKEEYEDRIIQGTKKTTPKEEEKPSSDIIEIVDGDSYMSEVETETDDVLYQEDEMVDPDDAILEVESNEESDDIAEAILKDDNQEDNQDEELESDLENNMDEENTEDLDNLDKQDNLEEQDNFLEVESEEISSDEEQMEGNEAPEEN